MATQDLYAVLQKLLGLHRQLLETIRHERQALISANTGNIQEAAHAKQALIETIRQQEVERLKITGALAIAWKRPLRELTLSNVIIIVQEKDQKTAEQLRSVYSALTLLIQRITDQNRDNQVLVEKSLEHVHSMKKNVLGESVPRSNTYSAKGQRSAPQSGARLISQEV